MSVSEIDYFVGAGYATVEEAVVGSADFLAADGVRLSDDELRAAVANAKTGTSPIEVRLGGAALSVERTSEGKYVVSQVITCA